MMKIWEFVMNQDTDCDPFEADLMEVFESL